MRADFKSADSPLGDVPYWQIENQRVQGMSVQEQNIPYGPGAYRASGIPDLPPGEDEQAGLMHSALHWGHYAGLDSATEVEYQLNAELHKAYERQEQEKRPHRIFCDAQRWRFENISKIPHLLFLTKWSCFFFPWFFWDLKVAEYLGFSDNETLEHFSLFATLGKL